MAILRQTSENLKQSAEYTLLTLKDFAQSPLGICHGLLAIYAAGFTMQIALLPYIIMELQQPVQTNGWVLGVFSICQFVGAPLFGRIGDAWGPRAAFVLAMASSALMYIMVAVSSSLPALFLSQLPGVMIHGTQAAMMVVALEIGEQHRTAHLAYLNLSYCVGLVAGGAVGASMAAAVGPRGTLIVAAAIQLCGCFLAFLLDEFNELFRASHAMPGLDLKSMQAELSRFSSIAYACAPQCVVMTVGLFPCVCFALLCAFRFTQKKQFSILMARYAFTPIAVAIYHLTPAESNVLVTLIGATMIAAEGVLAPILATRFGDRACIKYSCPIAVAGFLCLLLFPNLPLSLTLVLLVTPLCGGALLYICCTSQVTKLVRREELGSVLGLNASLFFLDAGLSQLIGLPIYAVYGLRMLWLVCVIVTALLAVYLLLIDAYTFKAFGEEQPVYFPLRSVYE